MSNNTVKARVQVKADTSANWAQYGNSIIPLLREPIFYSDTGQIKLGDGVTNVNQLPFFEINIDYERDLAFNVREVIIATNVAATLDQAILG